MAAKEMWDYLASATTSANSTEILDLSPQGAYVELADKNVVIHTGDDNSEERVIFSSSNIFYLTVPWRYLSEANAGTVFNLFASSSGGNGTARTFHYTHDDGHKYVVRFACELPRTRYLSGYHGFGNLRFKVVGRSTL